MSEEYSQKEENTFRLELFRRMDKQDSTLDRIETQTTRHNGRLAKLEWWRGAIVWAFGILIALILPITSFIKEQIHQEISSTVVGILSDYDIRKSQ